MRSLLVFISLIFLMPQQNMNYKLVVTIAGLKPLKGDLYVSLHNRPENFNIPDSAFMKKKITVNEENEVISFEHVPAGKYAIAIYHDENLNGMMETNDNGIPKEGYGFSTKSRFLGKPKFEQAAFEVNGNDTIEIKMIYHPVPGPKKDTLNKQ